MAETLHQANTTFVVHSYYPPSIDLPHYVDNESSVISLIVQFGSLWAAVLGISFIAIRRVRPTASRSDQLAFVWMCLSTFPFLGCLRVYTVICMSNTSNSGMHPFIL